MASKTAPAAPAADAVAETTLTIEDETAAAEGGEGGEEGAAGGKVEDGEEIVGGPHTMQQQAASHNIGCAHYQVEEVIGIMKENVEKVLERDAKLGEMEERAEILYEGASAFQKSAGSLKNKAMWANLKQTIIMVVIGLVLLLIGAKYMGFV